MTLMANSFFRAILWHVCSQSGQLMDFLLCNPEIS